MVPYAQYKCPKQLHHQYRYRNWNKNALPHYNILTLINMKYTDRNFDLFIWKSRFNTKFFPNFGAISRPNIATPLWRAKIVMAAKNPLMWTHWHPRKWGQCWSHLQGRETAAVTPVVGLCRHCNQYLEYITILRYHHFLHKTIWTNRKICRKITEVHLPNTTNMVITRKYYY